MGTSDTERKERHKRGARRLTSRSYDSIDYMAKYKTHYHNQFDIEKTRLVNRGSGVKPDMKNSMLAYTNYVNERQKRNQLYASSRHTLLEQRRSYNHTEEYKDNLQIQATHIPNSSHFSNGYNLHNGHSSQRQIYSKPDIGHVTGKEGSLSCRIPVTRKDKLLRFDLNDLEPEENPKRELKRDNTFPPINGPDYTLNSHKLSLLSKPKHLQPAGSKNGVTIAIKVPSEHDATLEAWRDSHDDEDEEQVDETDAVKVVTAKDSDISDTIRQSTSQSLNQDALPESSSRKPAKKLDCRDYLVDKKKQYSEQILKSAIETLKIMEQELDRRKRNNNTLVDLIKPINTRRVRVKRSKRLKLPTINLDIIPELESENSFTSDEDTASRSYRSDSSLKTKKKRSKLSAIGESSDEESEIYSTESEHEKLNGYEGNQNRNQNRLILPEINVNLVDNSDVSGSQTNKNKAQNNIRNKLRKKNTKLLFLQSS